MWLWVIQQVKILFPDYDEANYDDYFEAREDKIASGEIVVRDEDHIAESRGEFEAIDWNIFNNYSDDSSYEPNPYDSYSSYSNYGGYSSYGYYGY